MPSEQLLSLLDSATLAQYLGVPVRTLDQWAYRRTGPDFARVGRHRRYRPEAVERWIDAQTHQSGGAS